MCTLVGGAAAVIKTPGRRLLAAALGFSAGIMATVSVFDLIRRAAQILLWNFGRVAGAVVARPIFTATKNRAKAMAAVAVSGFAEPAGALWAWAFLQPVLESTGIHLLYGGIGGLMLYIALVKLLPASAARTHAMWTMLGLLAGVAVMGLGLHLM
jgi:zinc transporter ZupT